jgi:hypothetical protein
MVLDGLVSTCCAVVVTPTDKNVSFISPTVDPLVTQIQREVMCTNSTQIALHHNNTAVVYLERKMEPQLRLVGVVRKQV